MLKNNDTGSAFTEKRRYPRLPLKIKFQCEHTNPSLGPEDGLLHFYSRDLCCGGVFLEESKEFPEGSILLMEFKIPENEKLIKVKGLILRTDIDGSGIKFLTLNIDDFETIDKYINKHPL